MSTVEAGILAYSRCHSYIFNADKRPITVAAQRWTCTSFHLYALASGLAGHLNTIYCLERTGKIIPGCRADVKRGLLSAELAGWVMRGLSLDYLGP